MKDELILVLERLLGDPRVEENFSEEALDAMSDLLDLLTTEEE